MAEERVSPEVVWGELITRSAERSDEWIAAIRASDAAEPGLLGGANRDPESFEFTRRLIEFVVGTDDAFTSALGLREVAQDVPESLPARDRLAVKAGGIASLGLPWAVMPVARRWLRDRVSHLVLAAKLPTGSTPGKLTALTESLRRHTEAGWTPVVHPLGEPVYGPVGAETEIVRLAALAAHPAVKHLVVDPARIAPGGSDWSEVDDVALAATALRPIFEAAAEHGTVISVEPTSVRWLRLVPELLTRALADPALDRVHVGTKIFAELPESREIYDRISRWALRRVAEGGAPAEIVIGVAGVAGAERIASIQSGLAVPVIENRAELTAQLLRLCELALHPGRAAVLRPVIASEDPWVLAAVVELATQREIRDLISLRLRSGVAPGLAQTLLAELGEVRILLPVAAPQDFSGAVETLVGLAAEAADAESAASRLERVLHAGGAEESEDDTDPASAEREAFGAAALAADEDAPTSHRTQRRAREWDPTERDSALFYRAPDEPARFETGGLTAAVLGLTRGETGEWQLGEFAPTREIPARSDSGFANEPDTDASVVENRNWARECLLRAGRDAEARSGGGGGGAGGGAGGGGGAGAGAHDTVALSPADLDAAAVAEAAYESGKRWAAEPHRIRALRLRRGALAVVAARDRLLQTLALDTGAPVAELDAEINRIVDAGRYCGQLAEGLEAVRGATFVPDRLALVAADKYTPLSTQAEAVLATIAAGTGVLWTVPQRLFRSASALVEEWEIGGLIPGVVRIESVFAGWTLGGLVAYSGTDRAVVFGNRADARALVRHRPELRIEGHFHIRGSMVIAPSADLGRSVPDLVTSAFRGAGSDPRAIQAAILVGSVARSSRFRESLADAVRALRVGDTAHPGDRDPLGFDLGPLAAAPTEAGLRALTELGRGEEWLVQPQQLDDAGLLWSPGVRWGVSESSTFWSDAIGVPVMGVLNCHSLADGIAKQNAAGSGAVAGLQANDGDEILSWLEESQAAALSINRPTTATRIERQPSGGWNEAVMGMAALAGGPNWLLALGSWLPREGTRSETLHLRGLDPEVQLLIEAAQEELSYEEFDALRRAALADALAWRTSIGVVRDKVGLGIERNVLRYWPVATHVRLAEQAPVAALLRVLAAALLVRAPIAVSTGEVLPPEISEFLAAQNIEVSLERDDDWIERIAVTGPLGAQGVVASRVRLIGGDPVRVAEWMGGLDRAALWAEPVTMAGPVELLTLLREQSVSARAHRHGLAVAVPGLDGLLEG